MDRRIAKAIYSLIDKFHRLYGLEIYLFSHGGFGHGYWGFQVAAHRTFDQRQKIPNDGDDKYGRRNYSLVSYQHMVSIPSWAYHDQSSSQPEFQLKNATRTVEIEKWLYTTMNLSEYFAIHKDKIDRWRKQASLESAEKYVLFVQLAGLLAQHFEQPYLTPIQRYDLPYGGDYDAQQQALNNIYGRLGAKDRVLDVLGFKNNWVCRNGMALFGDEAVDVWDLYLNGMSPAEILNKCALASS